MCLALDVILLHAWSIPLPNAAVPVLMYFPEYNAILVPAESISPDYLPPTKRRKPIRGLVKLIKERMEGASSSAVSSENVSVYGQSLTNKPVNSVKNPKIDSDEDVKLPSQSPSTSEENIASISTQQPVNKPEHFLTEEEPTTAAIPTTLTPVDPSRIQGKHDGPQPNTFGPLAQFFQRPNKPFFPAAQTAPQTPVPEEPVYYNEHYNEHEHEHEHHEHDPEPAPVPQPSRPSFISYLPAGVTSYFQNPPRPFAGFFENRFPFFSSGSSSPRNPYIHYYTRTPTSEAFYYNSLHPTIRQVAYSDAIQSEISDYVNQVHQNLFQEQEISTPSTSSSTVMFASVPVGKNQATSLVLRPVAKAVAGPKGVAVASPVAKAVLKKGEKVDIDFDPDAVAIAGPGGQAHAHPKLIVSYTNEKAETDSSSEKLEASSYVEARIEETNLNGVRTLAYYGGALGHFLVIHPDGEMYITGRRRVPQGHKDDKEDEEDVGVAEENPTDGGNDSVAIKPPPENASVAEAKPVAVSIAGEGGVASAQPVGQAIVGPGGLAISRPVATAIAGIPGAENLVLKPEKGPGRATTGYIYSVYHPQTLVPQSLVYPAADSQRLAAQPVGPQIVAAHPLGPQRLAAQPLGPQPLAAQPFGPQTVHYHHLQPLVHVPNYFY